MVDVIDISEFRKQKQSIGNLIGKAKCLACAHIWDAEAPKGTVWLECPDCGLKRGRFSFPVEYSDPHWVCNCGCDTYHINTEGVYCPNCGLWQDGFLDYIVRT